MAKINWSRFHIKKFPQRGIARYSWLLLFIIAIGGFIYPYLGLLMIPMMIILLLTSLFKGRFWCGNVCPRGSFLEMFLKRISRNSKIPEFFKLMPFRLIILAIFFGIFGMRLWDVFQQGNILEQLGILFASMCLITTIIAIVLGIPFASRAWCSFCPMGSLQNLLHKSSRRSLGKNVESGVILEQNKCIKCAVCSRVCPMQLEPHKIARENNSYLRQADCIKCGLCVKSCPQKALVPASSAKAQNLKKPTLYEAEAKVKSSKKESNITEITFTLDKKLPLKPGQFILLRVSKKPEVYRAYSIVSAKNKEITVAIKPLFDGLASSYLASLKEGDRINLEGPMGDLTLGKGNTFYFIAAGIGITPFVALTEAALRKGKNVVFFHSAKNKKELFYEETFRDFKKQYKKNFEYIPTLTREKREGYRHGRIPEQLKEFDLKKGAGYYICGQKEFVEGICDVLNKRGIDSSKINAEGL